MIKRWAIPIAAAAIAIVAVAGVAFALTDSGDDGDDGSRVLRDADRRGGSGEDSSATDCPNPPCADVDDGGLAICIAGAIDCDDTIEQPTDDVCIHIFPTPPECADPDEPVSNEPPVTIIDGQDPNACNFVHNITACEQQAKVLAAEDLASRLEIKAEQVAVISTEVVEWPNACLGIEERDVACAEVITQGFRIVLDVEGVRYEYHTDAGSRAALVE